MSKTENIEPKKNKVYVSIIIPYHNEEPFMLERAIKSVTEQSLKNIEIIVVDDGSNDSYKRQVKEICDKDVRIRLLQQDNKGVSAARNYGIKEASGKYITFLDSDDEFTSDSILTAYSIAEKNNADMLIAGTKMISDQSDMVKKPDKVKFIKVTEKNKSFYKCALIGEILYLYDDVYINRGIGARFIKKEVAQDTLFNEDVKIAEDLIFTLDIYMKSKNVIIVKDLWYLYYFVDGSATHIYSESLDSDTALHLDRIRKYYDFNNRKECRAFCERILYCLDFITRNKLSNKYGKSDIRSRLRDMNTIYNSYPWIILKDKRCLDSASSKNKVFILAFRMKIYFILYLMKIKVKDKS